MYPPPPPLRRNSKACLGTEKNSRRVLSSSLKRERERNGKYSRKEFGGRIINFRNNRNSAFSPPFPFFSPSPRSSSNSSSSLSLSLTLPQIEWKIRHFVPIVALINAILYERGYNSKVVIERVCALSRGGGGREGYSSPDKWRTAFVRGAAWP